MLLIQIHNSLSKGSHQIIFLTGKLDFQLTRFQGIKSNSDLKSNSWDLKVTASCSNKKDFIVFTMTFIFITVNSLYLEDFGTTFLTFRYPNFEL